MLSANDQLNFLSAHQIRRRRSQPSGQQHLGHHRGACRDRFRRSLKRRTQPTSSRRQEVA